MFSNPGRSILLLVALGALVLPGCATPALWRPDHPGGLVLRITPLFGEKIRFAVDAQELRLSGDQPSPYTATFGPEPDGAPIPAAPIIDAVQVTVREGRIDRVTIRDQGGQRTTIRIAPVASDLGGAQAPWTYAVSDEVPAREYETWPTVGRVLATPAAVVVDAALVVGVAALVVFVVVYL